VRGPTPSGWGLTASAPARRPIGGSDAAAQAAAVAHRGAHALGAAGDAPPVATAGAHDDGEAALRAELRWQVEAMSDAVTRALASPPGLGQDRSGRSGPGASAPAVRETDRAVQTALRERTALR
jgi:hypothetical protein